MAEIPGIKSDVYFGAIGAPLPDWRDEMPDISDPEEADQDDDNTPFLARAFGYSPDWWDEDAKDATEAAHDVSGEKRDSSGKFATGDKSAPAKPKSIRIWTKDPRTDGIAEKLLGPGWTADHAIGLFGVPDAQDTKVAISKSRDVDDGIKYEFSSPRFIAYHTIYDELGKPAAYVDNFSTEHHRAGIGANMFADQVRAMTNAGFSTIRLDATRGGRRDPDAAVGYKVWPKFGFDAPRDEFEHVIHAHELPDELRDATSIQDLYSHPAGKQWWEENGTTTPMYFDVDRGSPSRKLFAEYLRRKRDAKATSESERESATDDPCSADDHRILDELWREIHEAGGLEKWAETRHDDEL